MPNDFESDARCKGLWSFESDITDSISTNDLTGSGTIAYDGADKGRETMPWI